MKTLSAIAMGFALLGIVATGHATELKKGDMAPDFTLKGSDGKTYHLKEIGKPVVLAWYPKAFTGGCTAECKSLKENGDLVKAYDVAYFTISTDDEATNKSFAESLSADYPILSDPTGATATQYGVMGAGKKTASRVTFYIGADGKIMAVDSQVDTKNAAQEVAATLDELKVAKKSDAPAKKGGKKKKKKDA